MKGSQGKKQSEVLLEAINEERMGVKGMREGSEADVQRSAAEINKKTKKVD